MDYSSENRFRDFDNQYGNQKSYQTATAPNFQNLDDSLNDSDDFFDSSLGSSSRNYSSRPSLVNSVTGEIMEDIGDDDNEEVVKPIKRKPRKIAPAKVSYLGWFDWKGLTRGEIISRLAWIFCFCMVLRLIFMDQGVIDFIRMENRLSGRQAVLNEIQLENKDLMNEIDLIKNNPGYQKKLVRDHLGAISSDEYLILFPNDNQALAK